MTDRLSLPTRYRRMVEAILREYVPEAEVWAYGSRIQGRSHDGSDLDLVIRSPLLEHLGAELLDLIEAFQESNIPFLVQVHDWAGLPESFHREIERDYVVVQGRISRDGAAHTLYLTKWRNVTLGDLIDIGHGFAFEGKYIHDEPRGDLLLTPGNFAIGGGFKQDKFKYYDGPVEEPYVLEEGDLLVTMTDLSKQADTLGYPAVVPACTDGRRYLHNQRLGKVIPKDTGELHTRFVYYLMCGAKYRHEVLASATGTTVKHTSPNRIRQFRFSLPPLPEQQAIARVLGALDDKIELNRRMNETLEEMARALFKSWFVDFEPVRAKMERRWRRGESLPGLPADLYDLFPDRLVDSELGEIPEGWGVGVLNDSIELLSGGTPKTSAPEYWNGDIPWFTAKDAPRLSDVYVLTTERSITSLGVENSSTKVLPADTTIVTARGTVGRLALLGVPMAMNQTCYGIRGSGRYPDIFTYFRLRSVIEELQAKTHGTIFDTITRETFKFVDCVMPSVRVTIEFEHAVQPMMSQLLGNLKQTHSLVAQRDALLPRLVSGEVGVYSSVAGC